MHQKDFEIELNKYVNTLPVSPQLYELEGDSSNLMDYKFYIVVDHFASFYTQYIHKHISPYGKMKTSIILDYQMRSDKNFISMFIYEKLYDKIHTYDFPSKLSPSQAYSAIDLIAELKNLTSSKNNLFNLPPGFTISSGFTVPADNLESKSYIIKKHIENTSKCDCGAKKLGYKDDDSFNHSYWCETQKKA